MIPTSATSAGRVQLPNIGPAIVRVDGEKLIDITSIFPTMRDLCEMKNPAEALKAAEGKSVGKVVDVLANANPTKRDKSKPWLLAPIDLQAIKAAGVTFAVSMLERVIEEKTRGDAAAANAIRGSINDLVGGDLRKIKPGSEQAAALKETLMKQGAWSQYLEVGIGPDAEIFTKGPVLSAVGCNMDVGIHPKSSWNNPEPEVVLAVNSRGQIVGATLGNDVNLRDVEGRSALLLGQAKDNNASAAVGPLVRFFDHDYTLDTVRCSTVRLDIDGPRHRNPDGQEIPCHISTFTAKAMATVGRCGAG